MAVLESIRKKFGMAATIIIALGLLSFIIDPNELISAINNMSSKYDVGKIGGKSISYTDFQEEVQKFTTINEMTNGTSGQGAQQQEQARNAAWQDLVFRHLFVKNAQSAGITVGTDELVDLTSGSSVSPLIAQNPAFMDENGVFSKDQLVRFIQGAGSDSNLKLYWDNLQTTVLNNQYFSKYSSLFSAASVLNPVELRRDIQENNVTNDVEFVMLPYGYQTDTTIVVSSSEIRDYYNDHKNSYKQAASRDIEYVVYEVVPSAEDIAATKDALSALRDDLANADALKGFVNKNSETPFNDRYYKRGELRSTSSELDDFVWDSSETVSDVIRSGNKFYIARVVESKQLPDSVFVKHILLRGEDAAKTADSLVEVVSRNAGKFAELAGQFSIDQGSAYDGEKGSLGWMTQDAMIPGFESVLTADLNKPYVINTNYGTHVVAVTRKTTPIAKKQVAIVEKEALPSKDTFNKFYADANRFATAAAGSYENYRKAVDTLGVYSHPINKLQEGSNQLGAINNTKEITRWAFDNKVGKVSPIITVDNNYFFIATLKGVHKEGIAKIDEVSSSIQSQLYFEKLAQKKTAEVAEKIAGLTDLEAIAEKLGVSVSSQNGVAFSSMGASGLDPKFIGALSVAPVGKVSAPVAGNIGTYIFKVNARDDSGSFYTEDDAKNRDTQMSRYMTQLLIPVMMEDADVKDNRARFF